VAKEDAAAGADKPPVEQLIESRRDQYLVAPKSQELLPQGVSPVDVSTIEAALHEDPECEVRRTIRPRGVLAAMSVDMPGAQAVTVAAMPLERVEQLRQQPQLIVERDELLDLTSPDLGTVGPPVADPGTLFPSGLETQVTVAVRGAGDAPLPGAQVFLADRLGFTYQGRTDANGKATVTVFGAPVDQLKSIFVKPANDYWNVFVEHPALRSDTENVIALEPLSSTMAGFPDQQSMGWGERAMRIDELDPSLTGRGARVAVIDSGAASGTHPDLMQMLQGFDVAGQSDQTWKEDTVGHGSHCAGVIAGRRSDEHGVAGIAPDAQVFIYKIFPGGRFSDLLEALDLCISAGVDVVNMSLGGGERSQLVDDKLTLARNLGVACIVAAGNSGGPVQYPATSDNVLAVAAMGKKGEFPQNSYHATLHAPGTKDDGGYFSAKFTCWGPEIDVCAPGVAIVSSVPPSNFTAMDGTSMAAPHVTGLATLLAAHHPDLTGANRTRNAERVDRLFDIIKQSCRKLDFGDPFRSGAGLPDAVRAFEVRASARPAGAGPAAAPAGGPTGATAATGAPGGTGAGAGIGDVAVASAGDPGGGAGPPPPSTAKPAGLEQLQTLMGRAGLGGEQEVRPQAAEPAGTGGRPPAPNGNGQVAEPPPAVSLGHLRTMMQRAGLLEGAGLAPQSAEPEIGTGPAAGLDELTKAMRRAGLR
jgi:subtilisin family serine protease